MAEGAVAEGAGRARSSWVVYGQRQRTAEGTVRSDEAAVSGPTSRQCLPRPAPDIAPRRLPGNIYTESGNVNRRLTPTTSAATARRKPHPVTKFTNIIPNGHFMNTF